MIWLRESMKQKNLNNLFIKAFYICNFLQLAEFFQNHVNPNQNGRRYLKWEYFNINWAKNRPIDIRLIKIYD